MKKPIKKMFLEILDEWDEYWKDSIEFHDFLNEYVEVDDDLHEYVVRKRRKEIKR